MFLNDLYRTIDCQRPRWDNC